MTQAKTRAHTPVELLAYRLADDEAQTLSGPATNFKAKALVYALAATLAGVESGIFCYIFGNIGPKLWSKL